MYIIYIYIASTSFPIKQVFATLDVRIQNHIPLFVTAPAHIMATINQLGFQVVTTSTIN